jgi:hypothetical protein
MLVVTWEVTIVVYDWNITGRAGLSLHSVRSGSERGEWSQALAIPGPRQHSDSWFRVALDSFHALPYGGSGIRCAETFKESDCPRVRFVDQSSHRFPTPIHNGQQIAALLCLCFCLSELIRGLDAEASRLLGRINFPSATFRRSLFTAKYQAVEAYRVVRS